MPRIWPGFLAVWIAIVLHFAWVAMLLVPGTSAYNSTPVHQVWQLSGYSAWRAAALLLIVAGAALAGMFKTVDPLNKILLILPQQLVLGISAAGAVLAIHHSHYADGVSRPITFIAADQLAVILTWLGHTAAILFLWCIHRDILTPGGKAIPHHGDADV